MIFQWYGLIVGIAIVVGWSVAERLEPKVKLVAPWILIGGLVGARIYHVGEEWGYYSQNWSQIAMLWRGGMSIWGAILGGGAGLWVGQRINTTKQQSGVIGAIVVALPLAQAIGRVANGAAGEFVTPVFGLPWWSAELILNLCLFWTLWMRKRADGASLVAHYLVGYGVIRLCLSVWREDNPTPAILMLLAGLTLIGYIRWLRR